MSDKRKNHLEDDEIQTKLKKRQIAAVRNKTYIFFLALFLFMFRPTFLSPIDEVRGKEAFSINLLDPITSMFHQRGEGGILSEIEELDKGIQEIEDKLAIIDIEKKVVEQLLDEKKQNTIINCLNAGKCEEISEELMAQIDFLRIFLIVNQLEGGKMLFDQKTLLRNLNEYMLRSPSGYEYGSIESIRFNGAGVIDKELKLNSVSFDMSVFFKDKPSLINFLDALENKAFLDLPVMYVIKEMNYNIPNYKVSQEVRFNVVAYYFEGLVKPKDDLSVE